MIHFELFLTWYAGGTWLTWEPQTISFFGLGSWNKYLGHSSQKRKSSHSSTVRFLYCLANFSRAARCLAVSRGFFCLLSGLQPSFFINLKIVFFPPTWPLLANCRESWMYGRVSSFVLSFVQNSFSCLIKDFRTSRSFLEDHFTTQRLDFCSFLEIYLTDKPVDLSSWAF